LLRKCDDSPDRVDGNARSRRFSTWHAQCTPRMGAIADTQGLSDTAGPGCGEEIRLRRLLSGVSLVNALSSGTASRMAHCYTLSDAADRLPACSEEGP
jgi:hypothetical protein